MSEAVDRERIDELHARASEHYLAGQFAEALREWEQLLELDPADRRAEEGVRLCRLMADAERDPAELRKEPDAPDRVDEPPDLDLDLDLSKIGEQDVGAAGGPFREAAPEEGIGDLLDERLSALGEASADTGGGSATPPELPDPERQAEGIDMGDLSATESIPLANTGSPSGHASSPASQEVELRLRDLLREARELAASGQASEALAVLDRVLILDEQNDEALALQLQLRGSDVPTAADLEDWMNQAVQLFHHDKPDESRALLVKILEASPEHHEALHLAEKIDGAAAGADDAVPDLVAIPLADPGPPSPTDVAPPDLEAVPLAPGAVPPAPESVADEDAAAPAAAAARRKLPPALAVVLVLAVAAAAGWMLLPRFLGGPGAAEPAPAAARNGQGGAQPAGNGDPGSTPATPAVAGQPAAAAQPSADLSVLIETARRHFDRGEYAEAVVAYNRVLAIDPDNVEARDGLLEAGNRFQTYREGERQLESARRAFDEMSYASALRLLYRLPDTIDPALVQGYIVNGWYNMGLQELKAGDPREAIGHFNEALSVKEHDPGVLAALALAQQYRDRARDSTYYRTVEALQFRPMD